MHTNQTVNYALSQFIGTDIPNPLTDYNGDMAKIDTAIKNVADASVDDRDEIAALKVQNGSETLETTAQTLSGAVNELNTGYGDVNTRLTTAEGKITADEGTLATVVGNVSTLAGKVSTVETKVGTAVLTTTAPDLSGAVNELDADIATESGKVVALQNQNGSEVLQTTAQTLSGAINELYNAPASGVEADDVSYDNTSSGLTATDVQEAIDELKGDIDDISLEASNVSYDNTTSGLTATNAQDAIDELVVESTTAKVVGKDPDGKLIYEKVFMGGSLANNAVLDASLTYSAVAHFEATGCFDKGNGLNIFPASTVVSNQHYGVSLNCQSNGLIAGVEGYTVSHYYFKVRYSLK